MQLRFSLCFTLVLFLVLMITVQPSRTNADPDIVTVSQFVEEFGEQLQFVSLLASPEILAETMEEYYADYVHPQLIAQWLADPLHALGRLTSSPWPVKIDVNKVLVKDSGDYQVFGQIVEVSSADAAEKAAHVQPLVLTVSQRDGHWQIIEANIVYTNEYYGFDFVLPLSWEGYTVVVEQWEGYGKTTAFGPIIMLRHPHWTEKVPRQDIPILVLTLEQWESMQQEQFHIGAAPINPSELGRNNRYVFALPARYNFSFLEGYEEVDTILAKQPLVPFVNE